MSSSIVEHQRELLAAFSGATTALTAVVQDADRKLREATAASEEQFRSARAEADKRASGTQAVFERARVFLSQESKLSKRDRQARLDLLLGAYMTPSASSVPEVISDPAKEIADNSAKAERALRYLRYAQGKSGATMKRSVSLLTVSSALLTTVGLLLAVIAVLLRASPDAIRAALGLAGAGIAVLVFAQVIAAFSRETGFRNPAEAFEVLSRSLSRARLAHEAWVAALKAEHHQRVEAAKRDYVETVVGQKPAFEQIRQRFATEIADEWQVAAKYAPKWEPTLWQEWEPSPLTAPALVLGQLEVGLDPFQIALPAFLPLTRETGVLIKAPSKGAVAVTHVMRGIVARLLTAFPPGAARFGVIDATGENPVARLLDGLLDYDETLVTGVCADHHQIRQLLDDWSVDDPNGATRVLIVHHFPDGFSDVLAHRFMTLVRMAVERKVFIVLSLDTDRPLPSTVKMAELEQRLATLRWADNRFAWHTADLRGLTLRPDDPPSTDVMSLIVSKVGKASSRYPVLFDHIAPAGDEWWRCDAGNALRVPVGVLDGGDPMTVVLGADGSGHLLIVGGPYSGKSSLLKTLVMSAALRYSPDELEIHLYDFTHGAILEPLAQRLPSVRTAHVTVRGQPKTGVFEPLRQSLDRWFAVRRVSDQSSLGQARRRANRIIPRQLVVIDGFDRVLNGYDALDDEVTRMLTLLVRAQSHIGVHVVLATSALSKAPSQLRQEIIRSVGFLILPSAGDEARLLLPSNNTGDRLVTQPGQALANFAGGRPDANHVFRIAHLGDHRLGQYADELARMASKRGNRLGGRATTPPAA